MPLSSLMCVTAPLGSFRRLRSVWRVSLLALPLLLFSCSTRTLSGGLMLVLEQDGSLELDELRVRVSEAGGKELAQASYRGKDVQELPKTLRIANDQPDRDLALRVSAWNGEKPLDVRDLTVRDVPADSVKSVNIVLSAQCGDWVELEDGEAVSKCAPDETCNPNTGTCVPNTFSGESLPEFGESSRTTDDTTDVLSDGSGGTGETAGVGGGRASDGSGGKGGNDGAGGMAGSSGGAALVEELGGACDKAGKVTCDRNSMRQTLICVKSEWESNGGCSKGEGCDPQSGVCAPIIEECQDQKEGDRVCVGEAVGVCGVNLVSIERPEECSGRCITTMTTKSAHCVPASVCPDEWWATGEEAGIVGFEHIYHFFDECYSTIMTTAVGGEICLAGIASQVADGMYSSMWGAGIGMQVVAGGASDLSAYTGFKFTINDRPSSLRVGVTVEGDENVYFTEENAAGGNTVFFDQLANGSWVDRPGTLDLTRINEIQWLIPSNSDTPVPFEFCLSGIELITE